MINYTRDEVFLANYDDTYIRLDRLADHLKAAITRCPGQDLHTLQLARDLCETLAGKFDFTIEKHPDGTKTITYHQL